MRAAVVPGFGRPLVLVALPASGTLSLPVFDTVLNGTSVIGSIVGTRADLHTERERPHSGRRPRRWKARPP